MFSGVAEDYSNARLGPLTFEAVWHPRTFLPKVRSFPVRREQAH